MAPVNSYLFNPFCPHAPVLYLLETHEHQKISIVFRGIGRYWLEIDWIASLFVPSISKAWKQVNF